MRRRVRWENVIRVAVAGLLVATVVAWPRLAPPEPQLPGAQATPLVPGDGSPGVPDEEWERRLEPRGDDGPLGRRGEDGPRGERRGGDDRREERREDDERPIKRRGDNRRRGDDDRRAERRAPRPPATALPQSPTSPPQATATAAPSPPVAQDPAAAEFGFEAG